MNTQNLKRIRESRHYTQQQVADKLGVTCTAYQNYEYGKREPNNTQLVKLAELFGVSTDYLLGRETNDPELVEQLAREFNMTALERKILENYLSIPETERSKVVELIKKTIG